MSVRQRTICPVCLSPFEAGGSGCAEGSRTGALFEKFGSMDRFSLSPGTVFAHEFLRVHWSSRTDSDPSATRDMTGPEFGLACETVHRFSTSSPSFCVTVTSYLKMGVSLAGGK